MDSKLDGGIDLHIHTTASDGTYTPDDILRMAARQGLRAIAITDHDSIDGARLAIHSKILEAPLFLPGVEISTQAPARFPVSGSLHILGYGIDVDDGPLQEALEQLQQARNNRTPHIVDRLNQIGVDIQLDQVMAEVGQGAAGRPHIGKVLIRMGYVASMDEAFDRYLGKNRPAYVDKQRIDCREALSLIRNAGGIPVLAHPYLIKSNTNQELDELLVLLTSMGLMGIEVFYPEHSPHAVTALLELARHHGLLVTGGTDFHGDVTPDIQIGTGRGDMRIAFSIYEKLVDALAQLNHKRN